MEKLERRINQIEDRIYLLKNRVNGTIVVSEQNKLNKEIKSLNKEKEKLLKKFNPN